MEHGASMWVQDSLENTILLILILHPNQTFSCQMYTLLLAVFRWCSDHPQSWTSCMPSHQGLTPFKQAGVEGNTASFQHLMQKTKHIPWNYGPLTSTFCDLTEVNSWGESSCLPQKQGAHQIPEETPVKQLVSFKWKKYGQWHHYVLSAFYPLCMICYVYRPLKFHIGNGTGS